MERRLGRGAALCLILGCARVSTSPHGSSNGDGGVEASIAVEVSAPRDIAAPVEAGDTSGPAPACGTGGLDPGEACDDGNMKGGDGCSADCLAIEKDFECSQAGRPCVYLVKCGDGKLGGSEGCDPPNVGSGCSAICELEPGWICEPPPAPNQGQPARCHRTICGDGNKEGSEACDDRNTVDGDGCSGGCTFEPDCSTGTCASKCGDSAKLAPEECDDGNAADGDGCSGACLKEMGFTCVDSSQAPPERLNLRVIYRDLNSFPIGTAARHPDVEAFNGMNVTPNLVKTMLGADGKPVMDGRCSQTATDMCPYGQQLTTQANFDHWYHDVAAANVTVEDALLLPRLANGSYVFDSGMRGFFPLDDRGWRAPPARESLHMADTIANDGGDHNFGFTTEIRYFFQYRGGETLSFSGDDDVWIFINRRLALDLGGLHSPLQRTLNVDGAAAMLGLNPGGLYEIALFHAERRAGGSNFKLTLTGFAPTSTVCRSACGDGQRAANEQCDDGNTTDGDGCSHDCRYEIVIP